MSEHNFIYPTPVADIDVRLLLVEALRTYAEALRLVADTPELWRIAARAEAAS